MRNLVVLGLKVVVLTVLLVVFYAVAGVVVGLSGASGGASGSVMVPMLLVCFLQSVVLSYLVVRSQWTG